MHRYNATGSWATYHETVAILELHVDDFTVTLEKAFNITLGSAVRQAAEVNARTNRLQRKKSIVYENNFNYR